MNFEHRFAVPVPIDEAWKILLDVEQVAPCMPGATLESVDGDEFTGRVKVKVGPITMTYRGTAQFVERDDQSHRAVIKARGKDAQGTSTAAATVTTALTESENLTWVDVLTDLAVTGKPAQFGRGVMADVGEKLIGRFAEALGHNLETGGLGERPSLSSVRTAPPAPGGSNVSSGAPPDTEAIDLLEVAGMPMLKRTAPIAAVTALLAVVVFEVRRRRHH